jgi:hypothetical protein
MRKRSEINSDPVCEVTMKRPSEGIGAVLVNLYYILSFHIVYFQV